VITATLIDLMGDDLTPVLAAKVSFDNDDDVKPEGWQCVDLPCISRKQPILTQQQTRLIQYLARGITVSEFDLIVRQTTPMTLRLRCGNSAARRHIPRRSAMRSCLSASKPLFSSLGNW